MVSERLQRIRETINRREKKVRSDRRAKSRRIERGEPEGARETATVKVRSAKDEAQMSADEARKVASDAKTLVATELGISRSESEGVIEKGASLLDEAGSQIDSLDLDGDGDTDLLSGLDQPIDDSGGNGSSVGGGMDFDPSEPIFDPGGGGSAGGGGDDALFDPFEDGPG